MLSHDYQIEPPSAAWQNLEAACSFTGQESKLDPARVPAVWLSGGFAAVVMLAATLAWSGPRSSGLLALCVLACVCAALRHLWAEARSVRKDGEPSEFGGTSASGDTGKGWDFELQPTPAEPHESVDSRCGDEEELVIWVELEDDEDESEDGDGLGENNGEDEDSDPWEWPNTPDAD
jgi:hypothetical protein